MERIPDRLMINQLFWQVPNPDNKYFDSDDVERILGVYLDNDYIRKCGGLSQGRIREEHGFVHYTSKAHFLEWLNRQRRISLIFPEYRTSDEHHDFFHGFDDWTKEDFDWAVAKVYVATPTKSFDRR